MSIADIANSLKELAERLVGEGEAEKAVWTTAYVNDLPDSSFLFIQAGGSKDSEGKTVPRSLRHLPYKDASGAIDLPHLRNAIARIPQMSAVPGLDKNALQKRAQAMLERANSGSKGGTLAVYKEADGTHRWFGVVSNHYRDNDRPAEIISGKAHAQFVARADESGKYPELWLWHVPGSKVGRADWLEFADGFLMSSGTFDKGKEAVAERLAAASEPLTMSHGFVRLKHDPAAVVTDGYWMFEESALPQSAEANPWTRFGAIKEASMPISELKKAFLAKYLDADTITRLEADVDGLKSAAEAAGVDWKEVEAVEVAAPAAIDAPVAPTLDMAAVTEAVATQIVDRLQMKDLSTMLVDIKANLDNLPALLSRVDALETTVKGLKQDDDTKMAKAMTPKVAEVFAWANYRPSQSKETVLKADDPVDEKLKASQPSALDNFLGSLMQSAGKGG